MIGTLVNGAAIVLCGLTGRWTTWRLPARVEGRLKLGLGAFALYVGGRSIWLGVMGEGIWTGALRGMGLLVGLMAGRAVGAALGLQMRVNRAGYYARQRFEAGGGSGVMRFDEGFLAATAVFCLAPLALVGPLLEGMHGDVMPLLIKAVMDGTAMLTLGRTLGWGAVASALPVVAGQGMVGLLSRWVAPAIEFHPATAGVQAAGGFLLLAVALVILGMSRVRLADYLPGLLLVPAVFWLLG